jgi:hypothetical protein
MGRVLVFEGRNTALLMLEAASRNETSAEISILHLKRIASYGCIFD